MENIAYMAINSETQLPFTGARGQVAFSRKGSLKNSMNQENKHSWNNGAYNYKSEKWEFYEINTITKTMRKVAKQ